MILLYTLSLLFLILIYVALVRGYLVNICYMMVAIAGAFLDIGCQLWIDVSKLFRSRRNRNSKYWNK
jgi:hypothetical protein